MIDDVIDELIAMGWRVSDLGKVSFAVGFTGLTLREAIPRAFERVLIKRWQARVAKQSIPRQEFP